MNHLKSFNSCHSQNFTPPNHMGFPHLITDLTVTVILLINNGASIGAGNCNQSSHGLSVDAMNPDLLSNGLSVGTGGKSNKVLNIYLNQNILEQT